MCLDRMLTAPGVASAWVARRHPSTGLTGCFMSSRLWGAVSEPGRPGAASY